MPVITIVAKLQAAPGKEADLEEALTAMVGNVKQHEKGKALAYTLHKSAKEPGLFLFYEQYADQAAVDAHGQTDHMKSMGRALRDQALLGGAPSIEFYDSIAGID
jgi:quinol monooxygenase YgiN